MNYIKIKDYVDWLDRLLFLSLYVCYNFPFTANENVTSDLNATIILSSFFFVLDSNTVKIIKSSSQYILHIQFYAIVAIC